MHDSASKDLLVRTHVVVEKPVYSKNKVHRVLSSFGNINGRRTESRAVRAWNPKWKNRRRFAQVFTCVRPPTLAEDNEDKYDLVFESIIPGFERIGVQIKTTMPAYVEFMKKHPTVPVVLISMFDSSRTIRYKTLFMMLYYHPGLADEMIKRGCQISPKIIQKLADITPGDIFCLI